jgi:hypothetical protein
MNVRDAEKYCAPRRVIVVCIALLVALRARQYSKVKAVVDKHLLALLVGSDSPVLVLCTRD